MNEKSSILILDDDKKWLDCHFDYFKEIHDLICIPTFSPKHAIYLGQALKSIKYAIIDEILTENSELSQFTGIGVIREIAKKRSDIKFVIITEKPEANNISFARSYDDLGVHIRTVLKDEFDNRDSKEVYREIIENFFKSSQDLNQASSEPVSRDVEFNQELRRTKILLLSANPTNQANAGSGQELRLIKDRHRLSLLGEEALLLLETKSSFEIKEATELRIADLRCRLIEYRPEIVHFCGHGFGQKGLALEDLFGRAQLVPGKALAEIIDLVKTIKCVILNACCTESQANEIKNGQSVQYVIAMNDDISLSAATHFSEGFYDAFFRGISIEESFKFGINSIRSYGRLESEIPTIWKRDDSPAN